VTLYPIKKKDYNSNPFIGSAWNILKMGLSDAYALTIFGYSAPVSDIEAVRVLKEAWGNNRRRNLVQIEVIDIKKEAELLKTWGDFIHTHHYDIRQTFCESWIYRHPRRTCEAIWNQTQENVFLDPNSPPQGVALSDLQEWFLRFKEPEQRQ